MSGRPELVQPPRLAERLLRASLVRDERAAVLGDLQEEFSELAESTGLRAARRWYWQQVLFSIGPNVARKVARDLRRRADEGPKWHAFRLLTMIVLIGIGLVEIRDATQIHHEAFSLTNGIGSILLGLIIFRGPVDSGARSRTGRQVVGLLLTTLLTTLLLASMHYRVNGVSVWFWVAINLLQQQPNGVQPSRVDPRTATEYWIQGPVLVVANGKRCLPAIVEAGAFDLGRPLVGVTTHARVPAGAPEGAPLPMRLMTDATFYARDTVRLFVPVNGPSPNTTATVDIVASDGHVVRSEPVPISPAQLQRRVRRVYNVPEFLDDDRNDTPAIGAIDVRVPLTDLAPGEYTLRITATDGDSTAIEHADIDVVEARREDKGVSQKQSEL